LSDGEWRRSERERESDGGYCFGHCAPLICP
jgi:hypothetical protein